MVFNRKRDHAKEHIARGGQEDRRRPEILLIIDTRQYMIID